MPKISKVEEQVRETILAPIITELLQKKLLNVSQKYQLPAKELSKVVEKFKKPCPWLTVNSLKQRVARKWKCVVKNNFKLNDDDVEQIPPPPGTAVCNTTTTIESSINNPTQLKNKGGRPKGSTNQKKRHNKIAEASAINEITVLYNTAKSDALNSGMSRCKPNTFTKIVDQVKKKRKLNDNFDMSYNLFKQRVKRKALTRDPELASRGKSLLLPIHVEKQIVELLNQLAEMNVPLTVGQTLPFINDLCSDHTIHSYIKKNRMNDQNWLGDEPNICKLGEKWFKNFLKRYKHMVRPQKPCTYDMHKKNYTTFVNFNQMYLNCEEAMISSGVAARRDVPVWVNEKGEIVDEKDSTGYKSSAILTYPEYCFAFDETGNNTSMEKDGNIGNTKVMGPTYAKTRACSSLKDKHFTVLGVTAFTGEPVLCVVIIEGETRNLLVETGVVLDAQEESDDVVDMDLLSTIQMNNEKFPGGPTCEYKGKKLPCMVRWTKSGGMTSKILTEILETMDDIGLFCEARKNGIKPYLLLDGHQTRFELDFVEYIHSNKHPWTVCIGVPYGTGLWQIGDSAEQNGSWKMQMKKEKKLLVEKRLAEGNGNLEILPTDIIPLVNASWSQSFARVKSNQKAIAQRGWNPLNRNLLMLPEIRKTIGEKHREMELEKGLFSEMIFSMQMNKTTNNLPTINNVHQSPTTPMEFYFNFSSKLTQPTIKSYIRTQDLHKARDQMEEDITCGKKKKKQLQDLKRISAGNMHRLGSNVINESIHEELCRRAKANEELARQKAKRELHGKEKKLTRLKEVFKKERDVSKMNLKQLHTIVSAVKRKEDKDITLAKLNKKEHIPQLKDLWSRWGSRVSELEEEVRKGTAMNVLTGPPVSDVGLDVIAPQVRVEVDTENDVQTGVQQAADPLENKISI